MNTKFRIIQGRNRDDKASSCPYPRLIPGCGLEGTPRLAGLQYTPEPEPVIQPGEPYNMETNSISLVLAGN